MAKNEANFDFVLQLNIKYLHNYTRYIQLLWLKICPNYPTIKKRLPLDFAAYI